MSGRRSTSGGTLRAMTAGMVALVAMAGPQALARRLGLVRLDFARVLGTAVTAEAPDSRRARAAGWAMNVAMEAAFAVGYQRAFDRLGMFAGAPGGALLGLVHAAVATAVLAAMPSLHPRPRQAGLRPIGPRAYGPLTVPGMLLGHVLFGAVVGGLLGRRSPSVVSPHFLSWLEREARLARAGGARGVGSAPIALLARRRREPARQWPEPGEAGQAA